MRELILLLCTVVIVNGVASAPANPVVGAIYQGPDAQTIIEGPDGSIITAQGRGGILEIEPIAIIPNQPAPVIEINREAALVGNALAGPSRALIESGSNVITGQGVAVPATHVGTVAPLVQLEQVSASAVSISNSDAVVATSLAPTLLAQQAVVPTAELSDSAVPITLPLLVNTGRPILAASPASALAADNIQLGADSLQYQSTSLIAPNHQLHTGQQITLQIQEEEQLRAQQQILTQHQIALQIQAVARDEQAARIRAENQALGEIRAQEEAAARIQAQQKAEAQIRAQQQAAARQQQFAAQQAAVQQQAAFQQQAAAQQQKGGRIQGQQLVGPQNQRPDQTQPQQPPAQQAQAQRQLESEIRAQEQAAAAQRTQQRISIAVKAQEQVVADIRAQEQAAAEQRAREEAEAQRRAEQETAEEIRAQEIQAAEVRTHQRIQIQLQDQEVAALRARQTAAEVKAQQLAAASAQVQQAAETIRARTNGNSRASSEDRSGGADDGQNTAQNSWEIATANDPRLSRGPQVITSNDPNTENRRRTLAGNPTAPLQSDGLSQLSAEILTSRLASSRNLPHQLVGTGIPGHLIRG